MHFLKRIFAVWVLGVVTSTAADLERIKYHHPGLVVDLGV